MKTPFPIHVSPERAEAIAAKLPEGGIKGVSLRQSNVPDPDKVRGESKSSYLKRIGGQICLDDRQIFIRLKGEGWSALAVEGKLELKFEIDGSHYCLVEGIEKRIRKLIMLVVGERGQHHYVEVESLQVPKDHPVLKLLEPVPQRRKHDLT